MTTAASTSPATGTYDDLIGQVKEASLVQATTSLLWWDQETMMPPKGVQFRSRQLAQLASIHHRLVTDPRVGELLSACEADGQLMADPTSPPAVNVREVRRQYDRQTKLPEDLVRELAEVTSLAQHEWAEARKDSDYARFRPWLEKIVALTRRKAECYGWPENGEAWDALAEDYEPGCTASTVETVFAPLRERLTGLVGELMASATRPDNAFNELEFPIEQQEKFVRFVSERIGFDFSRGRLDRSTHPFCSGTHCNDVRMTTRFQPSNVNEALGSTMHESGHSIYEQGLPAEHIGTPMGEAVSLGIHESQSRMWENQVGRSRSFWVWCRPQARPRRGSTSTPSTGPPTSSGPTSSASRPTRRRTTCTSWPGSRSSGP
jgi:carboxypeptidase Taq